MSDIKSRPYSPAGRANWDDIFGKKESETASDAVNSLVEAVRHAKHRHEMYQLREDLRVLVSSMDETDRMRAFRVFNAAIPIGLPEE